MEVPIDMPVALAGWLTARGRPAVASPVPDDLMGRLPLTVLRDSGGSREWPVIDRHRVGVDTYAATMGEALAEARLVFAALDEINTTHPLVGGVQTYSFASGSALPQEGTDPEHPDAPMATFLAEVSCRASSE
ncbi:MAG: hypothetical protein IKG69_06045 [Atopobiaceae bacterium]|nr:hypothetical protein [Atopobiaceae bacterium]